MVSRGGLFRRNTLADNMWHLISHLYPLGDGSIGPWPVNIRSCMICVPQARSQNFHYVIELLCYAERRPIVFNSHSHSHVCPNLLLITAIGYSHVCPYVPLVSSESSLLILMPVYSMLHGRARLQLPESLRVLSKRDSTSRRAECARIFKTLVLRHLSQTRQSVILIDVSQEQLAWFQRGN